MPRVKQAVITMRDGTILRETKDHIEYGPQLITTFAVEMQEKQVPKAKKWWEWNCTTMVKELQQVKVPIKSWPYSAIKDIDWGYISQEQMKLIQDNMAKAKQAADAKKAKSNGVVTDKGPAEGADTK